MFVGLGVKVGVTGVLVGVAVEVGVLVGVAVGVDVQVGEGVNPAIVLTRIPASRSSIFRQEVPSGLKYVILSRSPSESEEMILWISSLLVIFATTAS